MHPHSGLLSLGSSRALQCQEVASPYAAGMKRFEDVATSRSKPLSSESLRLPHNHNVREPSTRHVLDPVQSIDRGSIHSLPVEVLSLIFIASILPSKGQDHCEPINADLRFVCRLWRNVIDRTPQLWTYVLLRQRRFDPKQLRVLVDRSKTCPLELRVHLQCLAAFDGLLDVLQPAMARTRYLYLSCEPCNMHLDLTTRPDWPALYEHAQDVMRRLMETPAPLLEVLDLRMINVPQDIFTGLTPTCLRSVHLLDCNPVPRISSFFGSPLTSLVIDYCNSWDTVDDMLSALAALPHLRRFQWDTDRHSDHPPFDHPAAHEPKSLPLHHLEHLELSSSLDNVLSIIHILDFPASTTLIISGELLQEPVIGTQSFDDLCKRISQDLEPHLRRSFVEEATGFTSLVNRAYRGHNEDGFSFSWSNPSGDGPFPTTFEFGVFWDMENRGEYLALLQLMLSWPGMRHAVTRLVVDHEIFMAQESHSWSTVLRALPNLTNVDVSGAAAICMLRAVRASASSSHPSERYITSNLRTAKFIDVGPEFFPELLGMLSERRALSLPPLEIKLRGCEVDTESVTRLRRCPGAKSVEWDGWKKEEVFSVGGYGEQLGYFSGSE